MTAAARAALHGQGIIGTFAGPREPGRRGCTPTTGWGCSADGRSSRAAWARSRSCSPTRRATPARWLAAGTPVAAIEPGVGVRLAGGERIRARVVVVATPTRSAVLDAARGRGAGRVRRAGSATWRATSPVVKVNCALARLPEFPAAPGDRPTCTGRRSRSSGSIDETQAGCDAARRGELAIVWCELYFQSVHDPSVAPAGCAHHERLRAVRARVRWPAVRPRGASESVTRSSAAIARSAPDVASCVSERQVLAPADVEERVGLTGGHIFQGEILPDQMWDRRFAARTPLRASICAAPRPTRAGRVMARQRAQRGAGGAPRPGAPPAGARA